MRARFESFFESLRSHPDVTVLHAELLPPATDEALEALESWADEDLGAATRALYAACDGVQLRWQWKRSPHAERREPHTKSGRLAWTAALDDTNVVFNHDGLVMLPPIATILARDWSEQLDDVSGLEDDGEELSGSAANAAIRIFDWSSPYSLPAWLKASGTPVRIGTDHGIDWGDGAIPATDYLERIFAYAGLVSPRMKFRSGAPFATIDAALASLGES